MLLGRIGGELPLHLNAWHSRECEALDKAHQLMSGRAPAINCAKETPGQLFTVCVYGGLIKPPDFKQPNAASLVQVAQTDHGHWEVSCLIEQDSMGFLKATPAGHAEALIQVLLLSRT